MNRLIVFIVLASLLVPVRGSRAGGDGGRCSVDVLCRPLSKVQALNIALAQNGTILQARQDVQAAIGVSIQTKAIIYPLISATANYLARSEGLLEQNQNRTFPTKKITLPPPINRTIEIGGFTLPKANNQTWDAQIRIVQSIYEGGRLLSALRSSRLIREQSVLSFESTVSDTLLAVSTAYDDVISAGKQEEVRKQSVDLLKRYLRDIEIRYSVGDVPQFDVLRAEVEVANAEASQVQSTGSYRVAKQTLVELLGYDLPTTVSDDLPLNLTTQLDPVPYRNDLPAALAAALLNRTEIMALQKEQLLRNENVIVALAGYKPSLQAFAGYELLSRVNHRNAGDPLHGGLVGAQMSWPFFDGFLTRGRVQEAVARRTQAGEAIAETRRIVELQVRRAWSDLQSARAVLDAQEKNIERAVEALRLVEARYDEGMSTQVEVLSAQTALTDARATLVQGLRDFSVARSRMLRATGEDLQLTVDQ